MGKNRYYKNAALFSAIRNYVGLNELAAEICLCADKDYAVLKIQSVKGDKIKLKAERDKKINVPEAIRKALLKYMDDESISSSVISDLEDQYEIEYDSKMIDDEFIDQLFQIEQNSKIVEIVVVK